MELAARMTTGSDPNLTISIPTEALMPLACSLWVCTCFTDAIGNLQGEGEDGERVGGGSKDPFRLQSQILQD